MERKGFVFYKSFYDSIKELGTKDQAQIYNAIFQYQFEGKEIELKGVAKSIFTLIIPQLEANNKKYENGCKGGRPKQNQTITEEKPNNNLNITEPEPKEKDKDKDKDKDIIKENIKRKVFEKPTIEEIQNYCNERSNGINANAFYDFYESKNWYVGKNKMKDWKACVRTWEQRNKNNIKQEEFIPEWFDKDIKEQQITKEEQQEMEDLLKDFN